MAHFARYFGGGENLRTLEMSLSRAQSDFDA